MRLSLFFIFLQPVDLGPDAPPDVAPQDLAAIVPHPAFQFPPAALGVPAANPQGADPQAVVDANLALYPDVDQLDLIDQGLPIISTYHVSQEPLIETITPMTQAVSSIFTPLLRPVLENSVNLIEFDFEFYKSKFTDFEFDCEFPNSNLSSFQTRKKIDFFTEFSIYIKYGMRKLLFLLKIDFFPSLVVHTSIYSDTPYYALPGNCTFLLYIFKAPLPSSTSSSSFFNFFFHGVQLRVRKTR
jgi:hypothetical protein